MRKMNASQRIKKYARFGSKLGLERMAALCSVLGNPEQGLRVIHVAGTNGKGSVCRYIYESLRALGHTAGIFTSPYIGDFRERIEVNGEYIPVERLDAITDRALAAAELLAERGDPPTEFEIVTAIGLAYFAEEAPDFVVLEVGLGGRGDSTNIIKKPIVSIITQIALDHEDRLGDTEAKIAGEKAGIIKAGCPVISGATGEAAGVIAKKAYELGVPLIDSSKLKYRITAKSIYGSVFNVAISGRRYDAIELSMAGEHQVQNAVSALCALELLRSKRLFHMDGEALRRGMSAARLEARFQIAADEPLVIYDGAHNPAGARALTKTLRELLPDSRILFVCAILKDKAAREIVCELSEVAAGFIATAAGSERSLSAGELAVIMREAGCTVRAEAQIAKQAYNIAMGFAGDYDAIVFAGSLYMIGDIAG